MNSTSTKPAREILEKTKTALSKVPGVRWIMDPQMPFLIHCSWKPDRPSVQNAKLEWAKKQNGKHMCMLDPQDPIIWEMHVCKLHETSLCGIRLNRIRGAAIEYKKVAGDVMKAMNL
ncbi:hypothetical protein Ciccas_014312 [Cichlidogyrus casuarinus]|uniref:non-specific serine/threonine protein kinase n=1 Tax=Cichlidogyrus casuarinus TaxID=1844966 RepID=A0ABD2PLA1_9PLAT